MTHPSVRLPIHASVHPSNHPFSYFITINFTAALKRVALLRSHTLLFLLMTEKQTRQAMLFSTEARCMCGLKTLEGPFSYSLTGKKRVLGAHALEYVFNTFVFQLANTV